jgi:hypothetical protein
MTDLLVIGILGGAGLVLVILLIVQLRKSNQTDGVSRISQSPYSPNTQGSSWLSNLPHEQPPDELPLAFTSSDPSQNSPVPAGQMQSLPQAAPVQPIPANQVSDSPIQVRYRSYSAGLPVQQRSRAVNSSPWFMLLFLMVFGGMGSWAFITGLKGVEKALASQNWPSVQGQVLSSSVGTHDSHDSDSSTTYSADVRYTYGVNGNTYQGTHLGSGDFSSSNYNQMSAWAAKYPAGKQVSVYYDPANPATAVLETGFSGGLLIPLGVGAAFIAVSVFFVFSIVRTAVSTGMWGLFKSSID